MGAGTVMGPSIGPYEEETEMNEFETQCHCGNIRLALLTERALEDLPLRRCLCGFCSSRGSVYTSDSAGQLTVHIERESDVSRYRNPDSISAHTMFFIVCKTCGGAPVAISEIEGREYAVVNVKGGCKPSLAGNAVVDMDFDEEELEGRLQRRRATWIGNVIHAELQQHND
jgi:hypothetical protein